jgi:hypothetical protein
MAAEPISARAKAIRLSLEDGRVGKQAPAVGKWNQD